MNIIIIGIIACVILFFTGIIIAATANKKFDKICEKYSSIPNSLGMTGASFLFSSMKVLKQNTGIFYNSDENAGDCYISKKDIIVLNKKTFFDSSIVAIAVSSHEMGHSMQKYSSSLMLFLTNIFQLINRMLSGLFFPLLIIGGIIYFIPFDYNFVGKIFIVIGIISFLVGLILKLLLIPLEYNASHRGQNFLKKHTQLSKKELKIVKKIHKKALMTYIGSLFEKPYIILYKIFAR